MQLIVAVVAGAHGLKGHVRLAVRTDDPSLRFRPGVVLATSNPGLPALSVAEARRVSGSWRVRFEEVSGRDAAEALRGTELSIETDDWESGEDEWYDHELVGLPARTPGGEPLGTVTAVEHGGAQDLLVLATARGPVRVPFVTALVPEVSASGLVIEPLSGLFDEEEA